MVTRTWIGIGMKAANMNGKYQGDDLFINRLLNILTKSVPFSISDIKKIRKNVYYIETDHKPFMLKGYSSIKRLRLQESFTASLKSAGFQRSYSFYQFTHSPIYLDQTYFGIMEYIEGNRESFSYKSTTNRKAGLALLNDFHKTTSRLSQRYTSVLSKFKLLEKWQDREKQFQKNLPVLRNYLSEQMIKELLEWSKFALEGLKKENVDFGDKRKPVILHGDVAHHNFIKSKSGKLYLIDFDLISIGYMSADLLQYANRILPFIDWSLTDLAKYDYFDKYLNNKAFLYSLIYPTDIFRELNRTINSKSSNLQKKIRPVIEDTLDEFKLRHQFIKDVKDMIK